MLYQHFFLPAPDALQRAVGGEAGVEPGAGQAQPDNKAGRLRVQARHVRQPGHRDADAGEQLHSGRRGHNSAVRERCPRTGWHI